MLDELAALHADLLSSALRAGGADSRDPDAALAALERGRASSRSSGSTGC